MPVHKQPEWGMGLILSSDTARIPHLNTSAVAGSPIGLGVKLLKFFNETVPPTLFFGLGSGLSILFYHLEGSSIPSYA